MTSPSWTLVTYDVGHVIDLLCTRFIAIQGNLPERYAKRNQLIDDFISYTINRFQHLWIVGYDPRNNLPNELSWFEIHEEARTHLFRTIKFTPESAGCFARMKREDRVLYLMHPTT